jgi:pimeloyl-ACP methyl ester carboxylesterase
MANKEGEVGVMKKIYILHGWSYSTEKWQPFLALLKKKGFDTVMLNIPGLTAPLDKVWDVVDYVEWLKKMLEKEKGKVILVGHSNGGRIALAFTSNYPEKVDRLILLDSAGIYHNELPIRIKRLLFGFLSKAGKRVTRSPKLRKVYYKLVREHDYERANPALRKTMQNLITNNILPFLSEIQTPTTIIWGENDTVTPVSDGKIMQNELKNATLHIIKNARHSPQFTHVKEVVDIIA